MNKNLVRQIVNIFAVVLTLVVNTLAVTLPLNGQNTGAISDRFKVYFVPAGYVFSIWGLIYILLIAYALYQALPARRDDPRLRGIDGWFLLSNLANSAWIFAWHYNIFPLSLAIMLVLLGSLIAIYLKLGIGLEPASLGFRLAVYLTFSVYLGWITVATIANASDVLFDLGWNGWGLSGQTWFVVMLGAALLIALAMTLTRRDTAFLLVLAWAFYGIVVKQAAAPLVSSSALVGTILVAVMALVSLAPFKPLLARRQLAA